MWRRESQPLMSGRVMASWQGALSRGVGGCSQDGMPLWTGRELDMSAARRRATAMQVRVFKPAASCPRVTRALVFHLLLFLHIVKRYQTIMYKTPSLSPYSYNKNPLRPYTERCARFQVTAKERH
jgi:hypothetical protein